MPGSRFSFWRPVVGILAILGAIIALAVSMPISKSTEQRSQLSVGGDISDLITLDPGLAYEFSSPMILGNLYDTLVAYEGNRLRIPQPRLASRWSIRQTDRGRQLIFRLRVAQFASGRRVTANDVVYSLQRAIRLKGPASFLLTDEAKLTPEAIRAPDSRTVVLDLPAEANPNTVLSLLSFNIAAVLDTETVKAHEQKGDEGQAWLQTHSAGSGPYQLLRWEKGELVELKGNPMSFRRSSELQSVTILNMKDSNEKYQALKAGKIDVAIGFSPNTYQEIERTAQFKLLKGDSFGLIYLGMNSAPESPFADLRVREAVRYAINQEGIVNELLQGLGIARQTILPRGVLGADEQIYYPYDPQKAIRLLKEAGKAQGFTVDYYFSTGDCYGGVACPDLAARVTKDLAAVGIQTKLKPLKADELLKRYRSQKADLVQAFWVSDYPDPASNGTPLASYDAKSLAWRNRWQNQQASQLAFQAAVEPDIPKREKLYGQLTALMAKEGPYAILYQAYTPIALQQEVAGFNRNAMGDVQLEKVSKQ